MTTATFGRYRHPVATLEIQPYIFWIASSYTLRSGNDINIEADCDYEARHTVMILVPGSIVTGVREIKKK